VSQVDISNVNAAEQALARADAAYARYDIEGLITDLSAAIRGFTAADEKCRAAMACVRLGDVLANGLGNLTAARAWFARARRLVADEPPCLEQGWVAVAAMGCEVDDPDELLAAAELALGLARRFGEVSLETKALADAGLAHVQAGRINEGMALLDEAMALACGPAEPSDAVAKSVCSFFTACYYTADFERAGSWADLFRRQGLIGPAVGTPVFLSSHCDSVQATLLMELGRWTEAEAVLADAKAAFEAAMPSPAWHPDIALADLRVRQGRLVEAEALLLGKDHSIQALLPAVRLHLARGDLDLARAVATRGMRVMRDDHVRVAELLTALVDIELSAGDLDAARAAAAELSSRLPSAIPTLSARASAAQARVMVAEDRLDDAIEELERAVDELDARRVPWLRATLLFDLAATRERAGDAAGARGDASAARAIVAALDVEVMPRPTAFAAAAIADATPAATTPAAAELRRDGKWWEVGSGGTSVRLPDSKGLRYLAELVQRPGVEQHVLDLVDRIEGVDGAGGVDRRRLGDAGEVLDAQARQEYRRRIEDLRTEADDALLAGRLDEAEARQVELDQLVTQLAQAFGLGGRERKAGSAVERARLNVTRALRAAIAKLLDAMPGPAAVLDRNVRTGIYCRYDPADGDEIRWVVET